MYAVAVRIHPRPDDEAFAEVERIIETVRERLSGLGLECVDPLQRMTELALQRPGVVEPDLHGASQPRRRDDATGDLHAPDGPLGLGAADHET